MNIPWTESPAGIFNTVNQDFNQFASTGYTGSKEYLGYYSDSGQTDTDSVYFYNSFSEKITVYHKRKRCCYIKICNLAQIYK
jgi:hypothetical protein